MLKAQDCMLLINILTTKNVLSLGQKQLSTNLCYSMSEVSAGYKRLAASGLIRADLDLSAPYAFYGFYQPILSSVEEFLICGLKYVFPAQLGEYTRGIKTSFAAPVFKGKIVTGNEPVPVWPHPEGQDKGLALEPLYRSVPESLLKHPHQEFYDMLALVDAIRQGRARERNMAIKMLQERLTA